MTFDELRKAGFVVHHQCGGCGSPVGFMVHPELAAACFNSACDCGGPAENYRLLTHADLAAIPSIKEPDNADAK